jgi:hypothetical protein
LTFIHRIVGDRHRSEELFQDVFLSVWMNRAVEKSKLHGSTGRLTAPWRQLH